MDNLIILSVPAARQNYQKLDNIFTRRYLLHDDGYKVKS